LKLLDDSKAEDETEEIFPCFKKVKKVYWLDQEKFEMIAEYLSFTGSHVKKVIIYHVIVDPKIFQNFQNLLNSLPNLEALELDHVQIRASEEAIKWALKSRKIKRIKMIDCSAEIESLLESLEECVIEEAELGYSSPEKIEKFLKSQEKNLKKLTIKTNFNMPNILNDLRLEYLDINSNFRDNDSLEFLRHQVDLKILKLKLTFCEFFNQDLSMICELKQLETLELFGRAMENSGLNKLYQLQKLKRLAVGEAISRNILEHLKFGIFEVLEELYARFDVTFVESIQEMKRITPNLKTIEIKYAASNTINALLETLENLENVIVCRCIWENTSKKVLPKIKHLEVDNRFGSEFTADHLAHQFPNLEFLKIEQINFEVTEPYFVKLLSGLKRLKTLQMDIQSDSKLESEFILPCFKEYGKHLETVHVRAVENRNPLQERSGVIGFTIEKQPNEDICFDDMDDYSDSASDY
jgi:hypothetical protein